MAAIMFEASLHGQIAPIRNRRPLLIEDRDGDTRLSWVARYASKQSGLYNRVVSALQKEKCGTKTKFIQSANARLLELTPPAGRPDDKQQKISAFTT